MSKELRNAWRRGAFVGFFCGTGVLGAAALSGIAIMGDVEASQPGTILGVVVGGSLALAGMSVYVMVLFLVGLRYE